MDGTVLTSLRMVPQPMVGDIEVTQEAIAQDVAVVTVRFDLGPRVVIRGQGAARRNPLDRSNPSTGAQLAYARAFDSLARQLRRRAEGQIRHADWVRLDKQRRKAEAKDSVERVKVRQKPKPRPAKNVKKKAAAKKKIAQT